jgi:hypothetical protein
VGLLQPVGRLVLGAFTVSELPLGGMQGRKGRTVHRALAAEKPRRHVGIVLLCLGKGAKLGACLGDA